MQAVLVAALLKLLAKYAPKGIKWLIDGFGKRTNEYLTAHPNATAKLEQVAAAARGDANALAAVGEAPDALKNFLRTLFDQIGDSIKRPVVRIAFDIVAGFVVEKLSGELVGELFAAPGMTLAARPVDTSDVSAWQHSVLAAAAAAGKFDAAPAAAVPESADSVPTVNDPADAVPPVDPTAPTL